MRNGFAAPAPGLALGGGSGGPLVISPAFTSGPPLQPAFITSLCCQATLFFSSLGFEQSMQPGLQLASSRADAETRASRAVLASYLSTGLVSAAGVPAQVSVLLSCFLSYHGLPLPSRIPARVAADKLVRSPEMLPYLYWQQLAHAPDSLPDVVALHLPMLASVRSRSRGAGTDERLVGHAYSRLAQHGGVWSALRVLCCCFNKGAVEKASKQEVRPTLL